MDPWGLISCSVITAVFLEIISALILTRFNLLDKLTVKLPSGVRFPIGSPDESEEQIERELDQIILSTQAEIPISRKEVDIYKDVLLPVINFFKEYKDSGYKFDFKNVERLPTVYADPYALMDQFIYMISILLKFSSPGYRILIEGAAIDEFVEITINILTEYSKGVFDVDKIFRVGFTEETSSEIERTGAGLGLTQSKRIIDRHEGSIEYESIDDHFSNIRIKIPTYESSAPKPTQAEIDKMFEMYNVYDFGGYDLSGLNLQGRNLASANLEGAKLIDADLSSTVLYQARLQGANLNRANLSGAHMVRANLTNASMLGVDLTGADLTEAVLTNAKIAYEDLDKAKSIKDVIIRVEKKYEEMNNE